MPIATSTLTSKGQMTVPKVIRKTLRLQPGAKFDVEVRSGTFVVRPRRKLLIRAYRGFLQDLDDGRPTEEIIEEAKRLAAQEIVGRGSRS